ARRAGGPSTRSRARVSLGAGGTGPRAGRRDPLRGGVEDAAARLALDDAAAVEHRVDVVAREPLHAAGAVVLLEGHDRVAARRVDALVRREHLGAELGHVVGTLL